MRPDTRQDDRYKNEKEVKQDTTANKEPKIKDMVKGFIGKNVAIMLRGKKSLKGRLETVTQYEIIITINQQPVLIMKHAVDYIEIMDEP
jgi:sRNA-binding regulator protein Hfq